MAENWLVEKFDYAASPTPKYTGTYWNLADIHYFVDSQYGSDLNAGTALLPFKTLSKAQTVASNGHEIMINGYFDESLTITKTLRIIGVGGGIGGRAIFAGRVIVQDDLSGVYLDNIIAYRSSNNFWTISETLDRYLYASNCIFYACYFEANRVTGLTGWTLNLTSYYTILISCYFNYSVFTGNWAFRGNNNTFYGCSRNTVQSYFNIHGNNNHINNTLVFTNNYGLNNIFNTDGVYLDVTNYNFNFANTSPLYHTGTFNSDTQNYNHVGAGTEGLNKNALSSELTAVGGATLTNIQLSAVYQLSRPDTSIDGTILSYYIDFGSVKKKVTISIFNDYLTETGTGKLSRLIQESTGLTIRAKFDFILKYGDTTGEVDTCPDLLIEFDKVVTVSGTGGGRLGNADPSFDTANYTFPSFRYCIVKLRAKSQ